MEPLQLLSRILNSSSAETRSQDLDALDGLVKTGEFRDCTFTPDLYASLFRLVVAAFSWEGGAEQTDARRAQRIFWGAATAPEFDAAIAEKELSEEFFFAITGRTQKPISQDEWPFLRDVWIWMYE